MSIVNQELSRKSFLKITAGAIAGAAFLNVPHLTFAAAQNIKSARFSNLPDAVDAAKSSELVQNSYGKIKEFVNKIQNGRLHSMTMAVIDKPMPTFLSLYSTPGSKTAVYNTLVSKQLIDPQKTSLKNFLPPFNAQQLPQPFYSAPGSGYGSHHAYPGGLATHTAANLCISDGIYHTYKNLFQSEISYDIIIAAQALHDLAKPLVFQWQNDQASLPEYTIAGTGAHHIFSIAEVIYRNFPIEEIVAQACAHATPGGAADEKLVVGWLQTAAIIAGKDAEALGLVTPEQTIPMPQKQEGYIVSLGDHDFVLSGPACQKSVKILQTIAAKDYGMNAAQLNGQEFNRFRNYMGAQVSMMYLDSLASQPNGMEQIRSLVQKTIVK